MINIPDKTDIFSIWHFLLNMKHTAIFSTKPDRFDTQMFNHGYQIFVNAVKNHLSNFHRVFIRHAKTFFKACFFTDFTDPFANLLAPAVYNDRLHTDQF